MTQKELIMEATIVEFSKKGIKFTMDDISRQLNISKKTIYSLFSEKEALLSETVDYFFTRIKNSENEIIHNPLLDITTKIRKVLIVFPERYRHIDWRQIYAAKDKYPSVYQKIEMRLETEWDATLALFNEGISQGKIKPVCLPVLKVMVEASIEHFISNTTLINEEISFETALNEMINIIMDSIVVS